MPITQSTSSTCLLQVRARPGGLQGHSTLRVLERQLRQREGVQPVQRVRLRLRRRDAAQPLAQAAQGKNHPSVRGMPCIPGSAIACMQLACMMASYLANAALRLHSRRASSCPLCTTLSARLYSLMACSNCART